MKRAILIIAGLAAVVLFVPPFFAGIRNLGNVTGTVIAALLLITGAAFRPLSDRVRLGLRTRGGKAGLGLFSVILILIAVVVTVGSVSLVRGASRKPEDDAVLVVLGCKVRGETPSLMLIERLEAALEYLEEHPQTVCIVSGGRGSGENISEAECMSRWLAAHGIAPERLIRETASTDTRENLLFTQRILEERGLGTRVAICTNEFHEYRAWKIAESLGLEAGAVPARTAAWLLPAYWIRELYGFLYVQVFA